MNLIIRAARAYYRISVTIFEGLKRGIERVGDPTLIVVVISLVGVALLLLTGHSGAAMWLSLGSLLFVLLEELLSL